MCESYMYNTAPRASSIVHQIFFQCFISDSCSLSSLQNDSATFFCAARHAHSANYTNASQNDTTVAH